ncbi:MAG: CBS domain-containing protein [Rhodospirillaceae bacterium]|nr:CBS domain-containing protein [Rhodospirillaceae bacterium]
MLAKDIMTTSVVTAAPDTSIEAISHLMMTHNVSGLPVVNEQGAILGIVTEGDLILREQTEAKDSRLSSWWLRLLSDRKTDAANYIKTHGTRADEVMTRDVVTVSEDTPVGDIVRPEKR